MTRFCIDGGSCHHFGCDLDGCFRRKSCGPLSGFGEHWPLNPNLITAKQLIRAIELATNDVDHESDACDCKLHAALEDIREGIYLWDAQRQQETATMSRDRPPLIMDDYPSVYDWGE